jgi:hypothetical protein
MFGKKGLGNPNYKQIRPEVSKMLLGNNYGSGNKGKKNISLTNRNILNNPMKNPEIKEKVIHKLKNQPKVICEYCQLSLIKSNYIRWHGNNCKFKN